MAQKNGKTKISLKGDFEGLELTRSEGGFIVVDASSLELKGVTVITDEHVKVVKMAPAIEQENAPDVLSSSPTAFALKPENAAVSAGLVQLNRLSKYLIDLPDEARAELLVAPKDTSDIFKRERGTFKQDIASIAKINAANGIHYAGQILKGMNIADRPINDSDFTYERAWVQHVRSAWIKVTKSGAPVTTGLAIGTKQILWGRALGSKDEVVENNLVSCIQNINDALYKQLACRLGIKDRTLYFSATEDPYETDQVFSIDLHGYNVKPVKKAKEIGSSRPIALHIYPAPS